VDYRLFVGMKSSKTLTCADCSSTNITVVKSKVKADCKSCGRYGVIAIWKSRIYPSVLCWPCYKRLYSIKRAGKK